MVQTQERKTSKILVYNKLSTLQHPPTTRVPTVYFRPPLPSKDFSLPLPAARAGYRRVEQLYRCVNCLLR